MSVKNLNKRAIAPVAIIVVVAILLLGTIVTLVIIKTAQQKTAECFTDSDCKKVQTTCCPCESGGSEICVPHGQENIYRPSNCPKDPLCIAMYNCKIERCVCKEGTCNAIVKE